MDDISQIFTVYLKHNLMNDYKYQKVSMEVVTTSYPWAFVCFGIGVESGLGRLREEEVPYYLKPISKPYRDYLAGWVINLLNLNTINNEKANALVELINNSVIKYSVIFGNLGQLFSKEMKSKGDGHKFYSSLLEIAKP